MFGLASAKLGYSMNEFYDLSPIELYEALKTYNKDRDDLRNFELSKMRLQTFYMYRLKTDKIKTPEELMPFYFDEEIEVVIPTQEKWDKLQQQFGGKETKEL